MVCEGSTQNTIQPSATCGEVSHFTLTPETVSPPTPPTCSVLILTPDCSYFEAEDSEYLDTPWLDIVIVIE